MERILEYGPPRFGRRPLQTVAAAILLSGWLWILIGLVLIFSWSIQSIVWTGPGLLILGLTALVISLCGRSAWLTAAAICEVCFPLFIFALIFLLKWSPSDAQRPVPLLGVAFLVLMIPLIIMGWMKR